MSDNFETVAALSNHPAPAGVDDSELLRRYAESGSETAFAELVRRRIGLVYSVALRQTHGDRHRAEDATQAVFTDLARKAASLARRPVLASWLYRSAQFAAAGLVRAEQRRRVREQEANLMDTLLAQDNAESAWDNLRPVVDQALNEIDERDRDAIMLRYFDGWAFAAIGSRLRLTEGAARMRVERALDKLNAALARRGITSTTAALGAALAHQAGATMPASLAATVAGAALAQTAASTGGLLATFLGLGKLQIGISAATVVAGATGFILQAESNRDLRREIAVLQEQRPAIAMLRADNQRLASLAAEVEMLRRDDIELKQLEESVAATQKTNAEKARLARIQQTERSRDQGVQAEIDRMNREGNALVEEYRVLAARAKDPSLTAEERAAAEAAGKLKIAAIQAKQREVKAYIESAGGSTASQAQFRSRTAETRGAAAVAGEISAITFTPAGDQRVSLRLPQVDPATAFSAYERVTGIRILRDPSIAGVTGTVDLQTGPSTRPELIQALQTALRDQLNIVLEPTTDGNFLAKLGPPR